MKFNKILFVLLVQLFCILSPTFAANLNNILKNSIKDTNHVQKKGPSFENKPSNTDHSHAQIENKIYIYINRPELSKNKTVISPTKVNRVQNPQVKIPVKPQHPFRFKTPVNPRVKLNKAIRSMDQFLEWNKSCSMHSLLSPSPPDFKRYFQQISEAKCLEYIWKVKAKEEIDRRFETCKRRKKIDLYGIPNGDDAEYGEFPHMGAVGWLASEAAIEEYDHEYIFMCGSTLISENFALTASHCAKAPSENKLVRPGALRPKIVRFGVEKLYKQEMYRTPQDAVIAEFVPYTDRDHIRKVHDLALIKFENPVYFTSFVRPACIVPESFEKTLRATVSGWGVTKRTSRSLAKELQKTDVDIWDNRLCNKKLKPRMKSSGWNGLNQQICATNLAIQSDACEGDSGGPLQETLETKTETTVYNVLAVVSFNFVCASTKVPSIYTKIDNKGYMDWIEDTVWGNKINE